MRTITRRLDQLEQKLAPRAVPPISIRIHLIHAEEGLTGILLIESDKPTTRIYGKLFTLDAKTPNPNGYRILALNFLILSGLVDRQQGGELLRSATQGRRKPGPLDLSPIAMSQPAQTLEQIFEKQVQTLSLTLRPFTIVKYQYVARYFVGYLRETFPEVRRISQLRRDPHMVGWFRWLCELQPPVGNHTRRLLRG